MSNHYSIAEMSKFSKVSKHTLRYYDKIGLLSPAIRDEKNNYRYYSYSQLKSINMIERLKKLNLSLDEIKEYSQICNINSLEQLLIKQGNLIRNEIEELLTIEKYNQSMLEQIQLSKQIKKSPEFTLIHIPTRYIYKIAINFYIEELYDYIKVLYSSYISNIDNEPIFDRGEVVLGMNSENIRNENYTTYNSIGFFVNNIEGVNTESISVLKEDLYLVTHHMGTYDKIRNTYKKLYSYIQEKGYIIKGDAIETSIINITMTHNKSEFITEIQIPIKMNIE